MCQREDMREQLKWQHDRFKNARSDDTDRLDLYDVDVAYMILFLMVCTLENGGPVTCVTPELCVFTLQEQARRELNQDKLHEVTHWHAYIMLQLKLLPADFVVD